MEKPSSCVRNLVKFYENKSLEKEQSSTDLTLTGKSYTPSNRDNIKKLSLSKSDNHVATCPFTMVNNCNIIPPCSKPESKCVVETLQTNDDNADKADCLNSEEGSTSNDVVKLNLSVHTVRPKTPFSIKITGSVLPKRPFTAGAEIQTNKYAVVDSETLKSHFSSIRKNDNVMVPPKARSPMEQDYYPLIPFLLIADDVQDQLTLNYSSPIVDFEKHILHICQQKNPIPIDLIFSELYGIEKVGEGVFGEVYVGTFYKKSNTKVYKIVPIEGVAKVNGESQKRFQEVFPEIVICKKLNQLKDGYRDSRTNGFVTTRNIRIAQGTYPKSLVEAWRAWDALNRSDNDCPNFPRNQLYLVFEIEHGGVEIEAFIFQSAKCCFSVILQLAHALAVGEVAMEFEHRDLHWGNILVQTCESSQFQCYCNGEEFSFPSLGLKACIIDFTMARIVDEDGNPIFLDMKDDEGQFLGNGDHQFDVYRMMRDENQNNWSTFCPKSNVFWIHYLAEKLYWQGRYNAEGEETQTHQYFLCQLGQLAQIVLKYESCLSFVRSELADTLRKELQ